METQFLCTFIKKVNLQKQIRSYKIFSFTVVSFEKPFTLEAHYIACCFEKYLFCVLLFLVNVKEKSP